MLWALWLFAANLFLNTSFGRNTINRKPERLQFSWHSAWSWFPAQVSVRDLKINGNQPRATWNLTADRASGWINPWPLFAKEAHIHRVRGSGLVTTVDIHHDGVQKKRKRRWTTVLHGVHVSDVRHIKIESYALTGQARVSGDLHLLAGGPVQLNNVDLLVADGMFKDQDNAIFTALNASLRANVGPIPPGPKALTDVLPLINAELQLSSTTANLDFLDHHLASTPWLTLDGAGNLNMDLQMRAGVWQSGSQLALETDALEATFMDYNASGRAQLRLRIDDLDKNQLTILRCTFKEFELDELYSGHNYVQGQGLELLAFSDEAPAFTMPVDLAMEMHLPPSIVPDLRFYNRYFPTAAGLEILDGEGQIQGKVCYSASDHTSQAEIDVNTQALTLRFDTLQIKGALTLNSRIRGRNTLAGDFDAAGTRLHIDKASVSSAADHLDPVRDWWLQLEILQGDMFLANPLHLDAHLALAMRDIEPLLHYFGQRRKSIAWLGNKLNTERVDARANLAMRGNAIMIAPLAIASGKLTLDARLLMQQQSRHGQFLITYGNLAAAVNQIDDARKLHLFGARKWFASAEGWPAPIK